MASLVNSWPCLENNPLYPSCRDELAHAMLQRPELEGLIEDGKVLEAVDLLVQQGCGMLANFVRRAMS